MPEAVLLVGGRGTRLRPLTDWTPKPMLAVAGVPFIAHQMSKLRDAGVDRVVLATSYRAEVFTGYFGDGTAQGLEIVFVEESTPLGTGGAIGHAASYLTSSPHEPIVILNGDVLSGHDLSAQLQLHAEVEADVTLHLVEVDDARAFGCVPTDETGRVTAFLEKMDLPVTTWVNAGCYVVRREIVDAIPHDRPVSVERETFPGLLDQGRRVFGYQETAYWLDVGTPAALVRASADLVQGLVSSSALPSYAQPADGAVLVAPTARVDPAASLVQGSSIGENCVVGPASTIDASVLFDGASVGSGVRLLRSIVGTNTRIGADCVLVDTVVGDGAVIGTGNELCAGARVSGDVSLADRAIRFSPGD